jgi:5-methylcytosine-specific restriction endonuclease McrA
MIRKSKHPIYEVLQIIKDHFNCEKLESNVEFHGDQVYTASLRLKTFYAKGIVCAKCGLVGSYFAKEKYRNQGRYHLNLYGINEKGKSVLMTRDHIKPLSKGGADTLENSQTLCCKCNYKKGNEYEEAKSTIG